MRENSVGWDGAERVPFSGEWVQLSAVVRKGLCALVCGVGGNGERR